MACNDFDVAVELAIELLEATPRKGVRTVIKEIKDNLDLTLRDAQQVVDAALIKCR